VTAEYYAVPWYPLEGLGPSQQLPGYRKGATYALNKASGDSQFRQPSINALRLTIKNDAPKRIDNVRVDLRKFFSSDVVVVNVPGGKDTVLKDAEIVDLGEFKAGDSRTMFIWPGFNMRPGQSSYVNDIRVFTSDQRIRIQKVATVEMSYEEGPIERWLNIWADLLLTAVLIMLAGLAAAYGFLCDHYYKILLSHRDIYEDERVRYVIGPDKFVPTPRAFEMKPLKGSPPREG